MVYNVQREEAANTILTYLQFLNYTHEQFPYMSHVDQMLRSNLTLNGVRSYF